MKLWETLKKWIYCLEWKNPATSVWAKWIHKRNHNSISNTFLLINFSITLKQKDCWFVSMCRFCCLQNILCFWGKNDFQAYYFQNPERKLVKRCIVPKDMEQTYDTSTMSLISQWPICTDWNINASKKQYHCFSKNSHGLSIFVLSIIASN